MKEIDITERRNRQQHNYNRRFQYPAFSISRTRDRRSINRELEKLNRSVYLTDIYRTVYPITAEYIFFSSVCETLSKTDHILGH